MEDLKGIIEYINNLLVEDEQVQFRKLIDRLEGYELAYEVVVESNEQLSKKNEKLNEDVRIITKQRDGLGQSNADYQKDWERRGRKILKLQNELKEQSEFYEGLLQEKIDETERYKNALNELETSFLRFAKISWDYRFLEKVRLMKEKYNLV